MRLEADISNWIGKSVIRDEDVMLVSGKGQYIADLNMDGQLYMKVVRSPFPHAKIGSINKGSVEDFPGVIAVFTSEDFKGYFQPLDISTFPGGRVSGHPVPMITDGTVRFVGEPVAVIVATRPEYAEDAAEAIDISYSPLPSISRLEDAGSGSTLIYSDLLGNVMFDWKVRSDGFESAMSRADRVIECNLELPRLVAAPIEPRGCIAVWDSGTDKLTLFVSSQDPHRPKTQLAQVLGIAPDNLRVIVPEVGGAFGSKGTVAPEHALACVSSVKLNRPIKWIEDRSENFLSSYQGRGMRAQLKVGVDNSGRFLALSAVIKADLGAYLYPTTPVVPGTTGQLMTGVYEIPEVDVTVLGLCTNKVPTGPYRGAGRPEACYFVETMVEKVAQATGIDSTEIRRINFISSDSFPYRSPLGMTYDSGNYLAALEVLEEMAGGDPSSSDDADPESISARAVAVYVERAAPGGWESGGIEISPSGKVIVKSGSSSHGQGHKTSLAQIVAQYLGVELSRVEILQGDSEYGPGVGTFGSRSMTLGGEALVQASIEIKDKASDWVSSELEVSASDLIWENDRVYVAGSPDVGFTLQQVAQKMVQQDSSSKLTAYHKASIPGPVFPFGVYMAEISLDRQTGLVRVQRILAVDDGGMLINPLLAEGQVIGSTMQGVGSALFEEMVYDREGYPKSASFVDYLVPGANESDYQLVSQFMSTPTPYTELGAKGLGESGTIGALAAVSNAVNRALKMAGFEGHLDPPFSPERIWITINSTNSTKITTELG